MALMLTNEYQKIATNSASFNGVIGTLQIFAKYNSQNVNDNTSSVSYLARLVVTNGGYIYDGGRVSWNLRDSQNNNTSKSGQSVQWYNGNHDFATISPTVEHLSDGTRKLTISSNITFGNWGISINASADVELPTIPRASKINEVIGTGTPINLEQPITINLSKYSEDFTSYLTMYVDDTHAILDEAKELNNGDIIQLTESELNNLYNCTTTRKEVIVQLIVTTFNGDRFTGTLVGNTFYDLNVGIYDAAPIFSGITIEPYDNPSSVGDNTLVRTLKVKVNVPEATGIKGATISSYTLTNGEQTNTVESSGNYVFENIQSNVVKVVATDSRGNTTENIATYDNYVEYTKPIIKNIKINRDNNGVSTNSTLELEGTFFNGNIGLTLNNPQYKLFYRLYGEQTYIEVGNLTKNIQGNIITFNGNVNGDLGLSGYTLGKTFDIKVELVDNVSFDFEETVLDSGKPAVAFHKNGIAVGAPYDETLGGELQINGTAYYNGEELGTGGGGGGDTLPVGSIFNYEGTTVPSGYEVVANPDYSTTEHWTGKYWLDNRKIYEITLQITKTNGTTTSYELNNYGIPKIDFLWMKEGFLKCYSGDEIKLLPNYESTSYYIKVTPININTASPKIRIENSNDAYHYGTFYITLNYVKAN